MTAARASSIAIALLALAVTARGDTAAPHTLPLDPLEVEALTPIDTVPDSAHLDAVFTQPVDVVLSEIALSVDLSVDLGVQLRAIRTLAGYCPRSPSPPDPPPPCGIGTITHDTLTTLIDAYAGIAVPTPRDVLKLRAAIEALGISARSAGLDDDVTRLGQFLDHPSRDLRAATAHALGTLCNTRAIPLLRVQLQFESNASGKPQVRLAISAALRDLGNGQCTP
ncbi:MAG: HEAT repeat domain-containing protein [Proteobacteria bacterium]|nr:HEAT repeat domain-containing protein [Pseudomonadota bacterium]